MPVVMVILLLVSYWSKIILTWGMMLQKVCTSVQNLANLFLPLYTYSVYKHHDSILFEFKTACVQVKNFLHKFLSINFNPLSFFIILAVIDKLAHMRFSMEFFSILISSFLFNMVLFVTKMHIFIMVLLVTKMHIFIGVLYSSDSGQFVNMVDAGIIDPLKVIRTALVDAAR